MYNVQVLLSSYNGEKYIARQLDTILAQKGVEVSVLVRDDGSTDRTTDILKDYEEKYSNISVIYSDNKGVVASFFELFKRCNHECDFFALSDQDDVWDEDKLLVACNKLTKNVKSYKTTPAMYCCEPEITDENLNPICDVSVQGKRVRPSFQNALLENIAKGGGIVFSNSLLPYIENGKPEYVYMHDWWIYLTASCFGKVFYDPRKHYKYRQHSGNVLGAAPSGRALMKRRLAQSKTNKGHVSRQARAFAKFFSKQNISDKNQKSLDIICNYNTSFRKRLAGFSGRYLYRQGKRDNLIFRVLFFTNHL